MSCDKIDADAALDIGREQFQHPPGAGAEIEQRAERVCRASAARIAASTSESSACSLRMRSHSAAWLLK